MAGQATPAQAAGALAAGIVLWAFYFALGFRAFSRGMQANGLGSLLTLGLPALTYVLYKAGVPAAGMFLPPGSIYSALAEPLSLLWIGGPLLLGTAALITSRHALAHCDGELRRWYDLNHGRMAVE